MQLFAQAFWTVCINSPFGVDPVSPSNEDCPLFWQLIVERHFSPWSSFYQGSCVAQHERETKNKKCEKKIVKKVYLKEGAIITLKMIWHILFLSLPVVAVAVPWENLCVGERKREREQVQTALKAGFCGQRTGGREENRRPMGASLGGDGRESVGVVGLVVVVV